MKGLGIVDSVFFPVGGSKEYVGVCMDSASKGLLKIFWEG